jgi:hypothetical protein
MLLPKAMLGNFATVRKNAKSVLKKVINGASWAEEVNAYGLVLYKEQPFPVSLENQDDKSETMYYFNAFFEIMKERLTSLIENDKDSIYTELEFHQQTQFGDEIFRACLEQPWGGIALNLPFPISSWSSKIRIWMPEGGDTYKHEQYDEYGKMKLFLQKLVIDWEAITAIGKNYLGQPYTRRFFWDVSSQLQTSLFCLGVSGDRLDEVFGSIYERDSVVAKTDIPKSVFAELVAEALVSSKDYPEIGLSQIPE